MLRAMYAILLLQHMAAASFTSTRPGLPAARLQHLRHSGVVVARQPGKKPKAAKGVDFSSLGSVDSSGYRRGSFGIGRNESIVLWAVVALALTFGGSLDKDSAARIGDAQRSIYRKPSAEVVAIRETSKAARQQSAAQRTLTRPKSDTVWLSSSLC